MSLFTASYFVNWSYQNSKACTVLVGESTELFPASKATTLESNKSLARPHQSSLSTTGNETHSRPRRSVDVDGHASVTSVPISSLEPVTVDKMHEITTPSIDVSLAHGVESASGIIEEGSNASVVNEVDVSSPGDLTKLMSTTDQETFVEMTIVTTPDVPKLTTKNIIITESVVTEKETNINPRVETPVEVPESGKETIKIEKANIAYEPEDMQGDSFPSIYSYGAQKLQYLKLLTRLNKVNEELHINLKDAEVPDSGLKKFKYENEKSTMKIHSTIAPLFMTTEPITKTPITSKPTEHLTLITTNKTDAQTEHVVNTTPTPIVTNNNLVNITKEYRNTETTTEVVNEKTVNTPEMKTTEPNNPKHVLINLTISSDGAENSAYKPIYSLTLTVPTLGDTNEIPTVKITPMDVEPTQPSNFNKPVTLEGTTNTNKAINTEEWGGTCECACPICNTNTTDDFYDDYTDSVPSTESAIIIKKSTTQSVAETTEVSTDMSETEITSTTDMSSTTNDITSTTDFTTESDTEVPCTTEQACVCPKVEPPPILILEGEVDLNTISDNLLTVTTIING